MKTKQNGTQNGGAENPGELDSKDTAGRTALVAELEEALGGEPGGTAAGESAGPKGGRKPKTKSGRPGGKARKAIETGTSVPATGEDAEEQEQEHEPEEQEQDAEEIEGVEAEVEADVEAEAEEATEETEGTEGEEADAEAEGEATEDTEGTEDEFPKEWPKSARKRLGKLLKRVAELEAKVASATANAEDAEEAQDEEFGASGAEPTLPSETVLTLEGRLEAEIANREAWLDRIAANPDGLTVTGGDGREVTYTPEQLRVAQRRFERDLRRAEMQLENHRAALSEQTAQFSRWAVKEHAFLRDKTSEEYRHIEKVVRAFPQITKIPDHRLVLADALAWRKHVAAAKAAKGGSAGTPRPTQEEKPKVAVRKPVRPGAAPARVAPRTAAAGAAADRFAKSGSMADGAKLLESQLFR